MALEQNIANRKKRHLCQLPLKSFAVASGDVIGGLIYVMDKPLGIEEGMVGLSIDSLAYRQYLHRLLPTLDNLRNSLITPELAPLHEKYKKLVNYASFTALSAIEKELVIDIFLHHPNLHPFLDTLDPQQKKIVQALINLDPHEPFHEIIKVPWQENVKKLFSKKMHEINTTQYINKGMGGLLFEQYKIHCGINPDEHFAKQIQKLIQGGQASPDGPTNDVYMIKQDGQLGLFGGTGPGVQKILKTTTGKALQRNFTPKRLILTLGLSGLYLGIVLGMKRLGYLLKNKTSTVNADALCETLATKLANARGCQTQMIEILNGTYENGNPKFTTIVTWQPGCRDFSGKLQGSKTQGVVVAQTKDGQTIKIGKQGHLFIKKEIKKEGEIIGYQYIKIDKDDNQQVFTKEHAKFKEIANEYNKALSVSENRIDGLGESLTTFISLGDRDGIGKKGQNKGYIPGKQGRMQFFGIDFGKAYQGKNPIVDSLKDDFSFKDPKSPPPKSWFVDEKFYNYSMLYDNPLREKMKGIYMLCALRGKLTDPLKAKIAEEYELMDPEFAQRLKTYPGNPPTGGIDFDLAILDKEIETLRKESANPNNAKEYQIYIKKLEEIKKIAQITDEKILKVFEKRAQLLPGQIDALEKMEKLTARKAHILSPDGKVILNHIRITNADRITWQFDNAGNLTCQSLGKGDLGPVLEKIDQMKLILSNKAKILKAHGKNKSAEKLTSLLKTLNEVKYTNEIKIPLTPILLKTFNSYITENQIAKVQRLPEFRNQSAHNAFEKRRALIDNPPLALPTSTPQPLAQNKISSSPETIETPASYVPFHQKAKTVNDQDVNMPQQTQVIATQHQSGLAHLNHYLNSNIAKVKKRHHITDIQTIHSGASQKQGLVLTIENPKKHTNKIKVYAKDAQDSSIQFSVLNNLDDEQFRITAQSACRLAIFSANKNAHITIEPNLTLEKQVILQEAFVKAINDAIKKNIFTKDNTPRIIVPLARHKPPY